MSNVRIPPVLRQQTGGSREVQADGETVGQVLTHLADQFPALRDQLFEDGRLRRYINVFVNDQDIQYLEKLETSVAPQDTVFILPAMAGG
jgi:molybdopterin converting factor small subunit